MKPMWLLLNAMLCADSGGWSGDQVPDSGHGSGYEVLCLSPEVVLHFVDFNDVPRLASLVKSCVFR